MRLIGDMQGGRGGVKTSGVVGLELSNPNFGPRRAVLIKELL